MEWFQLLLTSPYSIAIVAIVFGCTVAIVHAVAKEWRKVRVAEMEVSLKAEMVKQGRSAEEIEQVLKSTGKPKQPVADDA